MKTHRKNKNKLTKRSNKKNKQNKKTQKRKQSGGNPSSRFSRLFSTLKSVKNYASRSKMGLNWTKKPEDCEILIERFIRIYQRRYKRKYDKGDKRNSLNITYEKKTDYVRRKLCESINKMLNKPDISQEVRKYLNRIRRGECDKRLQSSINSSESLDLSITRSFQ